MGDLFWRYELVPFREEEVDWEEIYKQLPKPLVAIQKAKKNTKNRWMSCRALLLLKEMLAIHLNETLENCIWDKNEKPFQKDNLFYFNVSHSGNCIGVVVSKNQPVGIDVERLRKDKPVVYYKVFTAEESADIEQSSNRDERFTELWTKKEAVVKLFGGGISMGLNQFSVLGNIAHFQGKNIQISKIDIPNHFGHLAVFC